MKKRNKTFALTIPIMAVLLVVVVYQYGYLKMRGHVTAVREVETVKMRTLEKYINLIAEIPELEKRLSELNERKKIDNAKVIEAQTLSLSAASLQDTVKGVIAGRGGTITSERVEKPEDMGKFKIINVAIDAVMPDTRALTEVIYGVETRTPYLVIRELDARVRNFRNPRELMVKLRISALTYGK